MNLKIAPRSRFRLPSAAVASSSRARGAWRLALPLAVACALPSARAMAQTTEPVGTASAALTATVTVTTAGTGGTVSVVTQGVQGLDFQLADANGTCNSNGTAHAYSVGDTCTVDYIFDPTAPGQRLGGIQLVSSGGVLLGNAYISGVGTGPEIAFSLPAGAPPAKGSVHGAFVNPRGVAVDAAGNVYVVDGAGYTLTKTAPGCSSPSCVTQIVSLDGGEDAQANGVAVDGGGNIFLADAGSVDELPFNAAAGTYGAPVQFVGAAYQTIAGVAVDGAGDVFFTNATAGYIGELAASNGVLPAHASPSYVLTGLGEPWGIAADGAGDLFFSEYGAQRVSELPYSNAGYGSAVALASGFGFGRPVGIALDAAGNVYVADDSASEVYKIVAAGGSVSASSAVETLATNTVNGSGVAVDAAGDVYYSESNAGPVLSLLYGTAPSLAFPTATGDGTTDATDGAQSFLINNEGNAALTLSALNFPTGFDQVAGGGTPSDCAGSTSLASGASCDVSVEFKPVAPQSGALSETLTVSSNNLNLSPGTQSVTLTATAANPPTVTAVSPAGGGSTGGATVTIAGTGFAGATAVHFGSAAAASFAVVSSTSIAAVAPAGVGTVDVTVTAPGGTSAASSADRYSYLTAITVVPAVGLTEGAAIAASIAPVTATGGVGPLTYSIAAAGLAAGLPAGLAFSAATGAIAGTPTAAISATTYTVTATDANGATASSTFVLAVNSPVAATTRPFYAQVIFTANSSPSPFLPVAASGGTGSLTYTVSPALPAGFSLGSATGVVCCSPIQTTSTITYTVTATDANGATASSTFQMEILAPAIQVGPQSLPAADVGHAYSATVTAKGGVSPYAFSLAAGSLPPGLTLNPATGAIAGTPTAAGSYAITVKATDSSPGSGPYSGTANWAVAVNSPVVATLNHTYSISNLTATTAVPPFTPVTATGGTGSLTYAISPALPAGLSIGAATGAIGGTPTQTTTVILYTVTAADADGESASASFFIQVSPPSVLLQPSSLPAAQVGVLYSVSLTPSGGTPPYSFATLTGSSLPPGLSLNGTSGLISGTPAAAGSFSVEIKATDSSTGSGPYSATFPYALAVAPGVPNLAFAAGTSSAAYAYGESATLSATSSSPAPIVYSVVSGPAAIVPPSGTLAFSGPGTVVVSAAQAPTANYLAASAQATLAVGQEPSVTLFAPPSATSIPSGQPITLTATVGAGYGVGAPTGTVAFVGSVDGAAVPLGSAPLVNGAAQFTYSGAALAPGSYAITAQYGGDANFLASSSTLTNAVTVTPYTFSVTLPASGSGSGSGGSPVTVALPGQPATLSLQLVPAQGTFQAAVSFTLTGLPSGATYTIAPNPIPAGSGATAVVVTINLPAQDARDSRAPKGFGPDSGSLIAFALLLPFAGWAGFRRGRRTLREGARRALPLLIATAAIAAMGACGSGGGFFNAPPRTYTATLTAASGSVTASMNFQLEVQ